LLIIFKVSTKLFLWVILMVQQNYFQIYIQQNFRFLSKIVLSMCQSCDGVIKIDDNLKKLGPVNKLHEGEFPSPTNNILFASIMLQDNIPH